MRLKPQLDQDIVKRLRTRLGVSSLSKPEIKSRIEEYMQEMKSARVAELEEVLEYLTSVMRENLGLV